MAPGSSGGALISTRRDALVGLNTNRIGEGFYLALPADAALRARVDALAQGESPKRVRLGVAIAPSHVARRLRRSVGLPEREGVLVRGVGEGNADAAGIEAGDLAGGQQDRRGRRMTSSRPSRPSATYDGKIVRGADERTVTVEAAKGPTPGDA